MATLIEKLNIGDTDISRMRFDRIRVRVAFDGVEERELRTPAGKNKSDTVIRFKWKLVEEARAVDGRVMAAGKVLADEKWINSADREDIDALAAKCKRIICALRGLPTTTTGAMGFEDSDKGRELMLSLSYSPGKDNPSDPEQGFQNFGYHPVKEVSNA